MNGMTIKVRIHPMYADFIKHAFGANSKGQVFASEKHAIGILIKNLLRTQPEHPRKTDYEPGTYIEFIIPEYGDVNTMYRNYISENSEQIIASKIRARFYYELHDWIITMRGSGLLEKRRAITLFCETFEISEDHVKSNTLERAYKRSRDKEEIYKKTKKIASVFMAFLSVFCPLTNCIIAQYCSI